MECVKLFLDHPTCNKDIVKMKNNAGNTAEMIADKDCARLIRKSLDEVNEDEIDEIGEKIELKKLTLSQVAKKIEEMEAKLPLMKAKMMDGHKKELDELNTERNIEMKNIEAKYKRKRDAALEKHDVQIKKLCSDNERTKKALRQELEKRVASSASGAPTPSTQPPPPSPASLLPICPVCYETMKPPLQIFTCGNGHLICSACKPEVTMCYCLAM